MQKVHEKERKKASPSEFFVSFPEWLAYFPQVALPKGGGENSHTTQKSFDIKIGPPGRAGTAQFGENNND